jgi:hypothetical protein
MWTKLVQDPTVALRSFSDMPASTPRKINIYTEFELDQDEELIQEISCSLEHPNKAPFPGFLFLTRNHICYRSLSQARVVKV